VEADKITLEPTEDGKRWRVKPEGGDVEGHLMPVLSIEPAGEDDNGEPLFAVKSEGEDVTGHILKM
jgi:hypothetical protein